MAKPLIEIVWVCRDCGVMYGEAHKPDCRFRRRECQHKSWVGDGDVEVCEGCGLERDHS